jgi:hypothetical protein
LLSFTYVYFFESRLFNGLRPIQIFFSSLVSYSRPGFIGRAWPGFGDLSKLARILLLVKKMSLENFQKAESTCRPWSDLSAGLPWRGASLTHSIAATRLIGVIFILFGAGSIAKAASGRKGGRREVE